MSSTITNRQQIKSIASVLFFLVIATSIANAKHQPNVILIMADDLGYSDLSCYGSKDIRTPELDQLASDGVRLTSFYAGCTICTPSRMALLTGAYPARTGWTGGVVGYGVKVQNGLAPRAITIAETFKKSGYQTALIGKWHLGDAENLTPSKQGFDTTFFINKSNNQTKVLWRGDQVESDPFDNRRLTERFAAEAIDFIEHNRKHPFFLYLPLSAPHFPAQSHPDWKGKSAIGAYGDVVEELDSRVGAILSTLERLKLAKRTIVVFISDNGVEPGQKQWARSVPFRGLKWSTLEGGNRVPCIIRWPGHISAGQVNDDLVGAIDLYPTLAAACGIDLPAIPEHGLNLDGVNVLSSFTENPTHTHARSSLLFWHGWGTPQAIRVGQWKLYFDEIKEIPDSKDGAVLINLDSDPAETMNLKDKEPEQVERLLAEARRLLAEIDEKKIELGGPEDKDARVPKQPKWLK